MDSVVLLQKPDKIIEQTSRVLNSTLFKRSKILSNFLQYVISETLEGNSEFLKEYVIATKVLNKNADFDPQLDGIVRIHANRLRKTLINYYEKEGVNDSIYISIPKGRYIPSFEINHNLQAKKIDLQENVTSDIENIPVIAVLPFKNFQKNERIDVVCSVMCQDLSIELTRFNEINVVSNYSTQFASENMSNIDDIISGLGVDYLITGSCLAEGEQLKINIELNSCREKQLLWADSYYIEDYEKDRLNCYKGVIQKVTAATCGFFGLIYRNTLNAHVPNDYNQLYAIYWHNKYHREFTEEAFHETLKAVEIGLENDSQNALLKAFKAELFLNLLVMEVADEKGILKYGTDLVKSAILSDRKCQHAYQVYAWSNLLNKNSSELYKTIKTCLSLNPNNPMYIGQMGFGYICVGDYEEGMQLMSESIELNPYYTWNLNIGICFYYIHHKDYNEALLWAEKVNRESLIWDPLLRTSILGLLNRKEEANDGYKKIALLSPQFSKRARIIVDKFIFDKELQKTIIQGLILAGININD